MVYNRSLEVMFTRTTAELVLINRAHSCTYPFIAALPKIVLDVHIYAIALRHITTRIKTSQLWRPQYSVSLFDSP